MMIRQGSKKRVASLRCEATAGCFAGKRDGPRIFRTILNEKLLWKRLFENQRLVFTVPASCTSRTLVAPSRLDAFQ